MSGENTSLQRTIGYIFHRPELLEKAMCHSSYVNEHRKKGETDNERLEFLGDAVLELVSSDFIFHEYPEMPEGDMTRLRASLVCEPTLAYCARQVGLGEFLFLGKGEDMSGGRGRDSILSDALEALIGAIYLDGGFGSARAFIRRFILTDIEHKKLFYDSKTILQEIVQRDLKDEEVVYELIGEEGPDHDKHFTVALRIGENTEGVGSGSTKKAAEQEAAYRALLSLRKRGITIT